MYDCFLVFVCVVPAHRCLIGCVFYLCDYPCLVGEDEIATWTQVVYRFLADAILAGME